MPVACTFLQRQCRLAKAAGLTTLALVLLAGCVSQGGTIHSDVRSNSNSSNMSAAAQEQVQRLAKTRLQLAALHFEEGRTETALGEVEQALQADPRSVDAYNLKGWIYLSLQDLNAARQSFEQAFALRPGDADTLYNLGWLQCQQKEFANAIGNFEKALTAPRSSGQSVARIWLAKGVCLRQAGRPGVLQAFEMALELEPANPAITYNLADVLLTQGEAERARFYARRLNNSEFVSAASLWLGIKIENRLGDRIAMRQLVEQLQKRFPDSREWLKFERRAFDE